MDHAELAHHNIRVNGIDLHYVEAGTGPLVLMLHGFPEFWYSWRNQIPALSAAGYRAVAVDMRGYNLSDKPRGLDHCRLSVLMDDVTQTIEALGQTAATLVAHDWGGMEAWAVAMHRPRYVSSLIAMNAPHPHAYSVLVKSPAQVLRSWYMAFFQIPKLSEKLMELGDFSIFERTLRNEPLNRDAFTPDDLAKYKEVLRQPGAMTAAMSYYRALAQDIESRRLMFSDTVVDVPAMLIWGDRDRYLKQDLADMSRAWAPGLRIEHLNASHWVQNDAPAAVNRLLLDFLAQQP